jgi:hypothetical protein
MASRSGDGGGGGDDTGTAVPGLGSDTSGDNAALCAENWSLLKFMPPCAALSALGTILYCGRTARLAGHLPPGCSTPPISLFGVRNPEYRVYAVGMSAVAGLFIAMAAPLHRYLRRVAPAAVQDDVTSIYQSGLVAFAGLATHGILPLQEDIVEIIGGKTGSQIEWTTSIHQMAAGVFFSASLYHGWQVIQLQWNPAMARLPIGVGSASAAPATLADVSVAWKGLGLAVGCAPLAGAMIYHPSRQANAGQGASALDTAGMMQYGVVGGIILMYLAYTLDFWLLERAATVQKRQ